jgi:hypothetical protein
MKHLDGRTIAALLIATAVGGTRPASAAESASSVHYVVTSVVDSVDGRLISEELLSFATRDGTTLVGLQDRAGRLVVTPATVDGNGIVQIETLDPAIVCYNVAMTILADAAAPSATSPLSVTFGGGTVTVPLQLTSAPAPNGTQSVTARGTTEAVLNDGRAGTRLTFVAVGTVTSRQRALVAARFEETSVLTTTGAAVARTTCIIARVVERSSPTTPGVI